jgi:hypothetical protein
MRIISSFHAIPSVSSIAVGAPTCASLNAENPNKFKEFERKDGVPTIMESRIRQAKANFPYFTKEDLFISMFLFSKFALFL